MSKRVKLLSTAMIAATLTCAATYADDTTEILNGQVNLNANIQVTAETSVGQAASAMMTAIGHANALTVDVLTPHDIENTQTFSGSVVGRATTNAQMIDGAAITTSTMFGNSAVVIVDNGMDVTSEQNALDGAQVRSTAQHSLTSYGITSVTTAGASANAWESTAYAGEANLDLRQDSGASVTADAYVIAPTAGLGVSSTTVAAANGNSAMITGYDAASQVVDVDQNNRGDVTGLVRVDAGGGSEMTNATASANGNNVRIENQEAYAHLQGQQSNGGEVLADSEILVGNFDVDLMTVAAEGVGNSAVLSNIGSNSYMGLDQTNAANVTARANFEGDAGGVALLSATAFGNAATSYICSECPVTAYGAMNQTNSATISSVVTGQMTTGGMITGTATAIGNSSTYQTTNPRY